MQEINISYKSSDLIITNITPFILNKNEKKQIELEFQTFCRKTFRALGKMKVEMVITNFKMMPEFKTVNSFLSFPNTDVKIIINHGSTNIVFDNIIYILSEWNINSRSIIRSIKALKADLYDDLEESDSNPSQNIIKKNSPFPRTYDFNQLLREMNNDQGRGK
jgi:hypothetical protein